MWQRCLRVSRPKLIERLLSLVTPATFRQGTLRLNLIFTLAGNTVQLGAQWASVMLLAKLGDPVMVGEYSLALGLCAPVITICSLGLRTVLVTDATRSFAYSDLLGARALGVSISVAGVAAEALFVARTLRAFAVFVVVALARSVDSLSDIYWAQLQRAERMELIAVSQALRGVVGIAVMSALLWFTHSLAWASLGLLAVSLGVWGLYDVPAVRATSPGERTWPTFHRVELRRILALTAPLVFSIALNAFAGPLPRYVLEAYRGTREVGFLAVASSPIALVGFLPTAIFQASAARAASHLQHGEHDAFVSLGWKVLAANVAVAASFYFASVLFGHHFLRVMFSAEYTHLWPVMNLFCLTQLLTTVAVFGSQVVNAGRMFRVNALISLLSVPVHLAASLLLVPRHGLVGSAYADMVYKGSTSIALFGIGIWWLTKARKRA